MNFDDISMVRYLLSAFAVCGAVVSLAGAIWYLVKVIRHVRKTVPTVAYFAGPLLLMTRYVDEEAKRYLRWFWRWTTILVLCLVAIALFYPFP